MSTALAALEDLNYQAVDNLPLALLESYLKTTAHIGQPRAIGVEIVSNAAAVTQLMRTLATAPLASLESELLFMTCSYEALVRRFSATRRRHPLAQDGPLQAGIARQAAFLEPLHDAATHVIDTTDLGVGDLRQLMRDRFGWVGQTSLTLMVRSFSYQKGLPPTADVVIDVRFLQNPHWVPALRPLTGLDRPVAQMIRADEQFAGFQRRLKALLAPLIDGYEAEGKSYLTIAFGCTGGRHRSVFMARQIGRWLRKVSGREVLISHRDLANDGG